MKKFLLSLGLFSLVLVGSSQVVLNEVYTEPGGTNSEFIELYNSSFSTQNVDCFTILTYWSSGKGATAEKGWYVIDLPNATIASKGWYVLAAASPFNVQSQTGLTANANWNSLAASGSLKKYKQSGAGYTPVTPLGTVTDLLGQGDFFTGTNYLTLLFKDGAFINGFWGGGPTPGTLPVGITGMNDLLVDMSGTCIDFTVDFSTIGAVEFHNPSGGTDNGYARTSDGKCGSWTKTSSSVNHTPGTSNGGAAGLAGELVTTEVVACNTAPGVSEVVYNITGVSGSASEVDDFPVEIQLYIDNGSIPGQLDGGDTYQSSLFDATVSDPAKKFIINQKDAVLLIYKTKRGCFDKIVSVSNSCAALPVKLKSFTANRNHSDVELKWTTATEQNNRGFELQKLVGAGGWEKVAFVASKADGGNSSYDLSYSYSDRNTTRGVTQYRLLQTDLDGQFKYSDVRSVRGESQAARMLVFPNPTNNGNVQVVFDEASGSRDVSLMDINGRTVKQWKNVTNNTLQIENLVSGMYNLRVINRQTGEQTIERIIVSKK